MACVQHVRSAQVPAVKQGTQLIPNVVATEQQSLIVVKKLLAIAVSSITYLRGLFPEAAYGNKYVGEQKVMILREELSCPGATQVVQWLQGSFDALQRKYLREIVLSIYTDPEKPQKVTECYKFKIQYTENGPKIDFESKNNKKTVTMPCNTMKASILLVRKLYTLMQNLGPLPDNVCLNMKLSYYDDVTPLAYQPPGFKEGDSDMEFEKEPVKLVMGEVVTPFHTLKVELTTESHRVEQVEEEQAVTVRDKRCLEGDGAVTQITPHENHTSEGVENTVKVNSYLDNTEVQLSCRETILICEEITENLQIDTLVNRTSDMEVGITKTRSGRVIKSTMGKKPTKKAQKTAKKLSPIKEMSQFKYPNSQEEVLSSSKPKKRKFSEPKEPYEIQPRTVEL